jgi:hypothetical protein
VILYWHLQQALPFIGLTFIVGLMLGRKTVK